jgi:hypothetical protein
MGHESGSTGSQIQRFDRYLPGNQGCNRKADSCSGYGAADVGTAVCIYLEPVDHHAQGPRRDRSIKTLAAHHGCI